MRIGLIAEGQTEKVFLNPLRTFLQPRVQEMPKFEPVCYGGRIPVEDKLKRDVDRLLSKSCDEVIAVTDIYTGNKKVFEDAEEAKTKMRVWVGQNKHFHPHAAQFEFEAWLLPFWPRIQKLAGSTRSIPAPNPESVNHLKPPSKVLKEVFRNGNNGRDYVKTRDAMLILDQQDLMVSIAACSELKALVNTILRLCGATEV